MVDPVLHKWGGVRSNNACIFLFLFFLLFLLSLVDVQAQTNIAQGKAVTSSSDYNTTNTASKAVDGNTGTRWESAYSDAQWIYVDLGANYIINRVNITWESAYASNYLVQVSNIGGTDNANWTTVKTVTNNDSRFNDHTGLTTSGRYVRMYGTTRATGYGYSIYEFEIYGTEDAFQANNHAVRTSGDCYELTPAETYKRGEIWRKATIDLTKSFEVTFNANFGSNDASGADGIAFVLQRQATDPLYAAGSTGEGLGIGGVSPSVAVEFDTYKNTSDLDADHTAIFLNGAQGSPVTTPVQMSSTNANVEDGSAHAVKVTWNKDANLLSVYFNGVFRTSYKADIISTVFSNNSTVYFGYTASTGGSVNQQSVCEIKYNQAPVITSNSGGVSGTISIAENTTAVTTVTSTDAENTARTYSIVGGADQAKFSINSSTGALSFTSAPNFESPGSSASTNTYTVIVRVTESGSTTLLDEQTLTVNVTNVNEAPTAPTDANTTTNTVAENTANGTTIGVTARSTDVDANTTLTYSLTDNAGGRFAINSSSGVVTVANSSLLDYETNQSHTITVQVSDGNLTSTQVFTIAVTNVNEAPVITSNGGGETGSISVNENNSAVTSVLASDVDANTSLTYSISGGADASKFTINSSTGLLSFINAPDYEAPTDTDGNNAYLVNVRVTDNGTGNLTDEQNLTVNVGNVTTAPVATDNLARNKPATASSIETKDFPVAYAFDGSTSTRWSSARTDNQWIYVDLGAIYNITEIKLLWEAAYGKDYQLQISNDASSWTTVQPVTGNTTSGSYLSYPGLTGSGRYVRMLGTARGTTYGYSLYEFEVYGTAMNTTPTITSNGAATSAIISMSENTTTVTTVTAVDDDANTITYNISGGTDAAKFSINASTGVLTFKVAPDFESPTDADANNSYLVNVRATDNGTGALYDEQALTVNVTNVNETPVASSVTNSQTVLNTATNAALSSLIATDDGEISTFQISTLPTSGVLKVNGVTVNSTSTAFNWADRAKLTFTPASNVTSDVTFKYTVKDAGGLSSNEATFTIPINGEPVASNVTNAAKILNSASATLLSSLAGNDGESPAGAPAFFRITSQPVSGILTVNGATLSMNTNYAWSLANTLRFDPVTGSEGAFTFGYTVVDSEGAADATPATFTINVVLDTDGDAVADADDQDDDNDGILDTMESNGSNPSADDDSDGIMNYRDANFGALNSKGVVASLDKDGDGVINALDLDSDNDGITDAVEQANGITPSGYDLKTGRLTGAVNANGVPANATASLLDMDGDGLANFLDIDADNDGLLDYLEAQTQGGMVTRSGNDADKDGIDDAFRTSASVALTPVDTEADGSVDFLDLDSDGDLMQDFVEAFDFDTDGESSDDLAKLGADFTSRAQGTAAASYYPATIASGSKVQDWLKYASDSRLSYLSFNSSYYKDTDADGLVDLLDTDNYGTAVQASSVNYAYRSGSTVVPLPVELISFTGKAKGSAVQLDWTTAAEINNEYFQVERSTDGIHYTQVGRVAGSGNSNIVRNYSFQDSSPLKGDNYYRLKQVDYDGKFEYSKIVAVNMGNVVRSTSHVRMYPNPVQDILKLDLVDLVGEKLQVEVWDWLGKKYLSTSLLVTEGEELYPLDLSKLHAGTYLIILQTEDGKFSEKIIKQ